jgi:hypothetical protein|tara:strand:- start:656 stop:982 length:327 start_codon:yes stop_codon:yes gene_type:complete
MVKYLKISLSDAHYLIPIHDIVTVEVGANTKVDILFNLVGHSASGAAEVLGVELTATTASDAAKTKEQLNSIVDAIEEALSTSWTKPFYVLEPKYPITGIAQLQEAWA